MSKPRFMPGPAIFNVVAVISMLRDGQWFYWGRTPKSPKVLLNMSVSTLNGAAMSGRLRLALERTEVENDG